jgi:ABC-2 type transport system permease protein
MTAQTSRWNERIRIILAITAKDLVEAIKNKNTLAVILPVLFIILMYRYLPSFTHGDDPTTVLVFDPAESSFGLSLEDSPFLNVYLSTSIERMKLGVSESERPDLGLALPDDIDALIAEGESISLQGYVVHWIPDEQVLEVEQVVEDELAALANQPIDIEIDSESIYPEMDSSGLSRLMGLSLTFAAVMIGVSFLPHLMLEEKMTQTIEAIMVSPVKPLDLALGKVLVGLTYSMVLGLIGIGIYGPLITQWGIAVVMYFAGALLMTLIGLVLGTVLENRQQLMLWAWVLLIPLLIPTFLVLLRGLVPDTAIDIMRWIPTVILTRGLTAAAVETLSVADYLTELVVLILSSALVLGLVTWILRRRDR